MLFREYGIDARIRFRKLDEVRRHEAYGSISQQFMDGRIERKYEWMRAAVAFRHLIERCGYSLIIICHNAIPCSMRAGYIWECKSEKYHSNGQDQPHPKTLCDIFVNAKC